MPIHPRSPIFWLKSGSKPPHERARVTDDVLTCSRQNWRTSSRSASASGGSSQRSKRNVVISMLGLVTQLDEETVAVARMHPGDVLAPGVDARALVLEPLHRAGDVLRVEPDEVHAFAVLLEELADGGVGARRLQELDVPHTERQDRVLEPELLRLL